MRYEIRELNVGGILDQAIKLTKDNFWLLVKISFLVLLPYVFLTTLLVEWNMPDQATIPQPGMFAPEQGIKSPFSPQVLIIIAASTLVGVLLVYPLTDAAMIYAIGNAYLAKPISAGSAYARAFHILIPLLLTWLLIMLAISAPTALAAVSILALGPVGLILVLVGVIFSVVFAFWFLLASRIVVIEGVSGAAALSRSKRLMKGNVGTAFVLGIVLWIIGALLNGLTGLMTEPILHAALSAIVQTILGIFFAATWVVFYFSCRCKVENFDLAMLADAVATENPPAAI